MTEGMHAKITADTSNFEAALDRSTRELKNLTNALNKSTANTKNLGNRVDVATARLTAMASAAVVAGSALAAMKVVSVAREFDVINASLKTVTGSTEEAAKAFNLIQDFAKDTPYDLAQVANSFIKLKALGLDPSIDALTSYGNTASAMGKSLNQMIEAVADASTGEFERLKEFGIKASSQGKEVTLTFQGVTTTIKKNAAAIEGYLRDIGNNQFAEAMAERVATLDGAISNLGDSWDGLFRTISEAGVGSAIEQSVRAAIVVVDSLNAKIRRLAGELTTFEQFEKLARRNAEIVAELREIESDPAVFYKAREAAQKRALNSELEGIKQQMTALRELNNLTAMGAPEGGSAPKVAAKTKTAAPPDVETDKEMKKRQEAELKLMADHLAMRSQLFTEYTGFEMEAEKERAAIKLLELQTALENEFITQVEFNELKEQEEQRHMDALRNIRAAGMQSIADLVKQSYGKQAGEVASALSDMLSSMSTHSKKAFEANKALAKGNAVVKGYSAAVAAWDAGMSTGGPWAPAVAAAYTAASIAKTSAQISAISSQRFGGGGSTSDVGGGGGGTAAAQQAAAAPASENSIVNINLEGNNFDRRSVVGLIEQINEAVADGARINIA